MAGRRRRQGGGAAGQRGHRLSPTWLESNRSGEQNVWTGRRAVASPTVSTLVCFHAHPDDEAIATGGTMALASAAGHRVVLIVATDGELGFTVPGVAETPQELGAHRRAETQAAASILGVHRVEFLGYHDSGMAGEDDARRRTEASLRGVCGAGAQGGHRAVG